MSAFEVDRGDTGSSEGRVEGNRVAPPPPPGRKEETGVSTGCASRGLRRAALHPWQFAGAPSGLGDRAAHDPERDGHAVIGGHRATTARVALLGCGTVGREVARRLVEDGPGLGLELVSVLVRDVGRDRGVDAALVTDRFEKVLDRAPDVVVEVIGGLEPAGVFVEEALGRGIAVVTANKTLVARRGDRLRALSEAHGAALAYEAAVGAGIPVIAALRQLAGDRVESIRGVVNGSCNYILTRMANAGLTLEEAIGEATERGLVEPDPSADISGRDSAEKLCVLAHEIGLEWVEPNHVKTEGLERVTREDLRLAARSGKVIKLIAELERDGDSVRLRVGPTLVDRRHPLASVDGEENAFIVTTRLAGSITLKGKGAGPGPTASAILGDVVRVGGARRGRSGGTPKPLMPASSARRMHRIRVEAPGIGAARVLEAIEGAGVESRDVLITRGGVCVDATGEEGDVWALCREIEIEEGRSLVAPVLDG